MVSPADAAQQRDARATNLRAQARAQKAELDVLISRAFSSSGRSRSSRGHRGNGHSAAPNSGRVLDTDVEFARKQLRNTYINLLFTCTFTRPARGVDNLMWNDTSYSLITAFRTQIAAQKKAADAVQPVKKPKSLAEVNRLQNELRRLLLDEEAFWTELIGRIVRMFSLDEARTNLDALGIPCDSDGDTTIASSGTMPNESFASAAGRQITEADEALSQAALIPVNRQHLIEVTHKCLIYCGDIARYRELHCRPSNEPALAPVDGSDLGPTAIRGGHGRRGRGSGNRGGSHSPRPSATSEEPKYDFSKSVAFYEQARLLLPDNGNPSNQLAVIATYNTDVFASIYHYYRALCVRLPFEKSKVNLDKTLRKPLEAWSQSGIEDARQWNNERDRQARDAQLSELLATNVAVSDELAGRWFQDVIVLHSLFFHRVHLDCIIPLSHSVLATFSSLVRARALQADQIVMIIVTSLCASWTTRLWRNAPASNSEHSEAAKLRPKPQTARGGSSSTSRPSGGSRSSSSRARGLDPATRLCIEHQILAHVLGIFRELIEVDILETQEAIKVSRANPPFEPSGARDGGNFGNVAAVRNLTAVVRRTLPALRIATKWMKTHLDYIQRSSERTVASSREADDSAAGQPGLNASLEAIPNEEQEQETQIRARADRDAVQAIDSFWRSYVSLINVLRYAFPFEQLPNIGKVGPVGAPALCLEEDSDMRGFAPTKKATQSSLPGIGIVNIGMGEACGNIGAVRPSQVHPNEEQLMRIADLLIDAKVVAESDASPISFDDDKNLFVYSGSIAAAAASKGSALANAAAGAAAVRATGNRNESTSTRPQDDASSEGYSEMTEDPVELAMRAVDGRRTGESSVMDGMEESLRSVSVNDPYPASSGAVPTAGGRAAEDSMLIPSQIKPRGKQPVSEAELAKLFGSSPFASPPSSLPGGAASGGSATAQDLLLQVLSGRSAAPSTSLTSAAPVDHRAPNPHFLFGGVAGPHDGHSGPHRGSIWSPGPADSHLPVGSPPQHQQAGAGLGGSSAFGSNTPPSSFGWNPMGAVGGGFNMPPQGTPSPAFGFAPDNTRSPFNSQQQQPVVSHPGDGFGPVGQAQHHHHHGSGSSSVAGYPGGHFGNRDQHGMHPGHSSFMNPR